MIETLKYWDRYLFFKVNEWHSPAADKIMWLISSDFFLYPFIALFLFWVFKKMDGKRTAIFLLGVGLCIACADLSTNLIKHSVQRYRPSHNLEIKEKVHTVNDYRGGKYGFFSSHAANAFAVTTLFFLGSVKIINRKMRLAFYFIPISIGYSRIYLGVHYPSDIFFGALNGIFFGWLIYKILLRYFFDKNIQVQ